jgi:DNA invertase Pin-like site-specific DNA recombinase
MLIGYARTSTIEQVAGMEEQKHQLLATGCKVFEEQISSIAKREQLEAAIDFVREGDTLVVTRLDRLARSTSDLLSIVARLEAKGVGLRIIDFGGGEVDTKSATGKMLITVLGAVAECERSLMIERQKVGIAKAKAEGRYRGRAPTARAKATEICQLRAAGWRPVAIGAKLNVSRASVYRILADHTAT